MLTYLLFSISALIIMVTFMITYFSYRKKTNKIRSKIYTYMIWFSFILAIVEITEGVSYVQNYSILFTITWKLHPIILTLFIAALYYYFQVTIGDGVENKKSIFWNKDKKISVNNMFTIVFIVLALLSIVYIETYPLKLMDFKFYTPESINFILIIYSIYILYNVYFIYLKSRKETFVTNDFIILIGTFLLFTITLFIEYKIPRISIYSSLFTLVLTLIYNFKENEDLLLIEELQRSQKNLFINNELKLDYLHKIINDLESPLDTFTIINKKLENCNNMSDEELNNSIESLNKISTNLIDTINKQNTNGQYKYRIDELVKSSIEVINPNLKQKPITFNYTIDPSIPALLMGDGATIQRIITGLLVNAIKHTNVGKITLTIKGEKQKNSYILNIKVADSGVGIKKEDFDKVFQSTKNYNANDNNANLSLIKRYVTELRGSIDFESYYGAGTTFRVNIPQIVASEKNLQEIPISTNTIEIRDLNNKKVIIVSSDFNFARKISNILKKYNLTINCIKSGREAINTIKCDEDYSLIIVTDNIDDITISDIGRMLKQLGKIINVPVSIAFTNNNEKYRQEGYYDEFLSQPLNLKELDDIIKRRC